MLGSVVLLDRLNGSTDNRTTESSGALAFTGDDGFAQELSTGPAVRIAIEAPDTLDPARAREELVGDMLVADLLFDGLTAIDPASGAVVPSLARSWSSSDDGRDVTFELDDGRTFSNGQAITAEAVVASIDRVLDRGVAVLAQSSLSAITEVVAADSETVVVRLRRRAPELLGVLANPVLGVVDPAAVSESFGGDSPPVVSGPYSIGGVSADIWLLTRRSGFDAGPEAIAVQRLESADDAFDQLLAGDAELAIVPASRRGEVADGLSMVSVYGPSSVMLGFNLLDPTLRDVRVRQAAALAIDPTLLAGPWRQSISNVLGAACESPCGSDPSAAAVLVAQISSEQGGAVTLALDVLSGEETLAAGVAEQLTAVGFTVEVRAHEPGEFASLAARGGLGMFQWGLISVSPGAGGVLPRLFGAASGDNVFGLASPDLEVAIAAGDYGSALALVEAAHVVRPLGVFERSVAMNPRVSGVVFDAVGRLRLDALAFD